MVELDKTEYIEKRANFNREVSRVEPYKSRRVLTANLALRAEYKKCLVQSYNELLTFLGSFTDLTLKDKIDIEFKIAGHLAKLKESFHILKLNYQFSQNLSDTIDINKITEIQGTDSEGDDNLNYTIGPNNSKEIANEKRSHTTQTYNNTSPSTSSLSHTTNLPNTVNVMAQSKKDFITLANQTINYRYDGNPMNLPSFLDAIDLLKELCEEGNEATFRKFIMTRLEGKAREAIVDEPADIDDIVEQLKDNIKTEPSKVVEGKILALRADRTSLTKFAEQAEVLAEKYRHSLEDEGFAKDKARELAVDNTIEMCRRSAKNDTVKAVLAASNFHEPKDVVAKMIIEINNLKLDKPNTSYTHKYNGRSNGNGNGNSNSRNGNNSNGRSNNHFRDNRNRNNGNGNYRHNNNNNGNRSGYQNSHRNGQNYQSNNANRNDSRRSNEQNVRLITGNETNPGNGGQSQTQSQTQA